MEKLFGRTYETIGSTGSDFIIKTKGQVKIQWGGKFIDIVKDGKLAVDADTIKSVNSLSDITSDGLYLVKENGSIYVYIDGNLINLVGEVGTTYVSFNGKQTTTGSQKQQALSNIGLIYPTLEDALLEDINNGFVYIINTQKIYVVDNGKYFEYSMSIPNPYPKQLGIKKDDDTTNGSIVIYKEGKQNGININELFNIYSDNGDSVLDGSTVVIRNDNRDILTVNTSSVNSEVDILSNQGMISNTFKSIDATSNRGFRLYINKGESTLEVDNIIWRNKPLGEFGYVYPSQWFQEVATISSIEESSENIYSISFEQLCPFLQGNILCTYVTAMYEIEGETMYEDVKVALSVLSTSTDTITATIELVGASSSAESYVYNDIISALQGKKLFFVAGGKPITRLLNNNIDLLYVNSVAEEEDINNIKTRIGSIQDLNFTRDGHNIGTLAEGNIGIYSDNLITVGAKQIKSDLYAPTFKASPSGEFPKYDTGFDIPVDDDSKTIVTSEWVNDKTDKRLEEYVRKDQIISLIESYIQPVDGTDSNPAVLLSGTVRRATNASTEWYFIGSKKDKITNVEVTVEGGLMTVYLAPASGKTIFITSVSAVIGDTGQFNGNFSAINSGGRSTGGHWCNAIQDPNNLGMIRIREYHQANSNNDSWSTDNWNPSNGPISVSLTAFGYIK